MSNFRIPNTENPVEVRQAFQSLKSIVEKLESQQFRQWVFWCGNNISTWNLNISFEKTGKTLFHYLTVNTGYTGYGNSITGTNLTAGVQHLIFFTHDGSEGITGISANSSSFGYPIPDISDCVNIIYVRMNNNTLRIYTAGTFTTQKNLTEIDLSNNYIEESSVNQLLIDVLSNYRSRSNSLVGTINLSGVNNAAPTGDGLTAKTALVAAGWTVTTN